MLGSVVEVMLKKNKAWTVTDACTTNLLVMLLLFMSQIWLAYMKVKLVLQFFLKIGPLYTNLSHSTHCIFY